MRRLLGLALVLGGALLSGCAGTSSPSVAPTGGATGASLAFASMDGATIDVNRRLADGKNVVLVFWQAWCEPCLREAPILARAARAHADALEFVGIVSGPQDLVDDAAIRAVVAEHAIPYPQVRDLDGAVSERFGVTGTPTIIVLGAGGAVRFRGHHPPADWRAVARACGEGNGGDGGVAPQDRGRTRDVERKRTTGAMGTNLTITVQGPDAARLDRAIAAAEKELRRVEDLMTSWRASPLTRLNAAAGKGPQHVPTELAAIIARGKEIGRLTGGAFDISFAAAGSLWRFKNRADPSIPDAAAIDAALVHVDYRRIEIDPEGSTVSLPAGFRIGLGGIAKGYGVDRAMRVLMEHGVKHAVVDAGGDMKVLGRDRGKPWEIAIKHPRDRERVIAALDFSNTCVVTSGDYERFFVVDGKRYHHILDPRTGRPSTGCMSATVVAQNAEYADALATAICVLGPKKGLELVERLKRVEAFAIDLAGEVHASSGLKGLLEAGASRK